MVNHQHVHFNLYSQLLSPSDSNYIISSNKLTSFALYWLQSKDESKLYFFTLEQEYVISGA